MKRKTKLLIGSFVFVFLIIGLLYIGWINAELELPYPQSAFISTVDFNWNTHKRFAPGSDNWPITWADDDYQYTSWGDGGGFGGTNNDGRVSLGIARVEGSGTCYHGFNVWGGTGSKTQAAFEGKSYGIISIGGVLYIWVSPGSNTDGYIRQTLYKSNNHGRVWEKAKWSFERKDKLAALTFLQFGKDYTGARDEYVYIYAVNVKDDTKLKVQVPGEIVLLRVHNQRILERDGYEAFAGMDEQGNPTWNKDISKRKPVFSDINGVGWNCAVSYNPGLKRYFLSTEHSESFKGKLGVFDSTEPWGPWTTVSYFSSFGVPFIEQTAFFCNFSNKWLSSDGKDFVLVFTGIKSNDSWNTVEGQFHLVK